MGRVEKTVFLSYRRTNFPWAQAIFQNLSQHGYDVFMDFTGIASGDFERVILDNIKARAHFIVLLTPSALERCGEPTDWLRREIETALNLRRNIVPLMLENFDFRAPGIANQLIGTLQPLKGYNPLRVHTDYFDEAMVRLREKFLNVSLDAVPHPASLSAQRAANDQKAAALSAPDVQADELMATEWFERGFNAADPEEELRCYGEAIRLKPDYAEAFYNRGIALQDKGDLDGAIEEYGETIRLKPDYAEAFNNRGNARSDKDDLEDAIEDYSEAIRLKPDYAVAFYNRGNARRTKRDLEGAIQDYSEAIRLKPDYAAAFNNRGVALRAKGDLEGALREYTEAIRLKPDYAAAFNNRGAALQARGDLEGAIEDYSEAIRLKPDEADAFNNRGAVLQAKGEIQGAIADFQKYLDLGGGARHGDQGEVEKKIRDLKKSISPTSVPRKAPSSIKRAKRKAD